MLTGSSVAKVGLAVQQPVHERDEVGERGRRAPGAAPDPCKRRCGTQADADWPRAAAARWSPACRLPALRGDLAHEVELERLRARLEVTQVLIGARNGLLGQKLQHVVGPRGGVDLEALLRP